MGWSSRGGMIMVIVVLEEKCLSCSAGISGTIEWTRDTSRTMVDFESEHSADVQSQDDHRILRSISVQGRCRTCDASFSYKVITVVQMRLDAQAARQK